MLGFGPPTTPFAKAMAEQGLGFGAAVGLDEWIKRLGSLPLAHQPGEQVLYNTGSDVAGLMIARASGMSFSAFLKQRLFEPLGMKDTAFHVPAEKIERFSSCYSFNTQKRELELQDDARAPAGRYAKSPAFESGGGGLVSTLDDYLAFGRMMLNKGKYGNKRLLSRPTVETMTTDYLTAEQKRTSGWFPGNWEGRGWGLGVAVITDRLSLAHSPGRFGWDGAFGTQWWADPREGMNTMLMVQRAGGPSNLGMDFLTLAYQAIED
jgi:CubicO group peptidase (beta-lactamase class C family)